VRDGWLTLEDVVRLTSAGAARAYKVARKGFAEVGMDGDLVVVDPAITSPIPLEALESKVGWSPYAGVERAGWPVATILRGRVAWRDGEFVGTPTGRPVEFD
jgi:dihydroorotase-like cyclic amidohydrolase